MRVEPALERRRGKVAVVQDEVHGAVLEVADAPRANLDAVVKAVQRQVRWQPSLRENRVRPVGHDPARRVRGHRLCSSNSHRLARSCPDSGMINPPGNELDGHALGVEPLALSDRIAVALEVARRLVVTERGQMRLQLLPLELGLEDEGVGGAIRACEPWTQVRGCHAFGSDQTKLTSQMQIGC
jgi:hypothetical protein